MAVDLWSAMLTLFLIMDPLGNLPIVVAILKDLAPERRRLVLIRELVLSLIILLLFLYGGQSFLNLHLWWHNFIFNSHSDDFSAARRYGSVKRR
jgi:small neutral amino acid transporter SnatA (MarC family)